MRDYFEAEMRYLRESARQFAEKYPEYAAKLNLQSTNDSDPYIERLLEGVAFLTGRIQQKIDDDVPEICESLLSQLWPQALQSVPSMTILQFTPDSKRIQTAQKIPAGTLVSSEPVGQDKTCCKFRTILPIVQYPLAVTQVSLIEPKQGGTVIKLRLQVSAAIELNRLNLTDLPIFLHADMTIALQLYFALLAECKAVHISFPEFEKIPMQCLECSPFFSSSVLLDNVLALPANKRSFIGFQHLLEYFCFQEKYLFVSLNHLAKITWPEQCHQIDIAIHTNTLFPREHQIHADNFKVNCVPAANLFTRSAEPIQLTHQRSEYPLYADKNSPNGIQLHQINTVIGKSIESGRQHQYTELHNFQHRDKPTPYYTVKKRWLSHHNVLYYLALGGFNQYQQQTLSIDIIANNGGYPHRYLDEGVLFQTPQNILGNVKNLTRPTPMYHPAVRKNWRWRIIAHLALNLTGIQELGQLKQLLTLYNRNAKPINQRRIDGITAFAVSTDRQFKQGTLKQYLVFSLQCDEEYYLSIADIYLFGSLLHQVFCQYAPINYLVTTKIYCCPSAKELQW